jgi:hypothetical protein
MRRAIGRRVTGPEGKYEEAQAGGEPGGLKQHVTDGWGPGQTNWQQRSDGRNQGETLCPRRLKMVRFM